MSEIITFNSKSNKYWQLSNFYGGCEICYMKDRFENPEIKDLFDSFNTCTEEQFINYLKLFQPNKKWTEAKLNYWFKTTNDGKIPIRGILAKLIGTSVKNTPTGKQRQKIISNLLGVETPIKIKTELNSDQKKELMSQCLGTKFKDPYFKEILLSTKNSVLHEKPMRGSGDNWTYPGGDWLGTLLMQIRDEINTN